MSIELICKHEVGNPHDTHAAAMTKFVARECHTVGHITKKFSYFHEMWWCDLLRSTTDATQCFKIGKKVGKLL